MEFDTTQASLFFDRKRPLGDDDNNRNVDPRTRDSIINSFSQAAAANHALAIPYNKHPAMGDVNDLLPDSLPDYGTQSMQFVLADSTTGESFPFSCPPPSYETAVWQLFDTQDQTDQVSNGRRLSISIQATLTPLGNFEAIPPDCYRPDTGNEVFGLAGGDVLFAQEPASVKRGPTSADDHPSSNGTLTPYTSKSQENYSGGWLYQSAFPYQQIPSVGHFAGLYQQSLPQCHVDEQHLPPFNFGPAGKISLGDNQESILSFLEGGEETKIRAEPADVKLSDVVNQAPQTLPSQEDMMANFSLRPQPPTAKRSRKRYTEERKKKVHDVRARGACTNCQARKVPVSFMALYITYHTEIFKCSPDVVCATCLRFANNHTLMGNHICVRSKMKDDYIGVGGKLPFSVAATF